MSAEHAHDAAHAADSHGGGEHHGPQHYIKIWGILLVLLVISVAGPFLEIQIVTLITAFGIAFVKAYMVAKNFMHLNVEKPFIKMLMATCLVFMVLFFAGTSPDVMRHEGRNWENVAAKKVVAAGPVMGEGHHEAAAGHEAAPAHGSAVEAAPVAPVEVAPAEVVPVEGVAVPVEAAPVAPVEAAPTEAAPVEPVVK